MSTRARLAACLVLCLGLLLPTMAWAATEARSSSGAERALVELVNDRRAEAGLPALTARADLHGIARDWSFVQAERDQLGHNPNLNSQACCWTRIAENVARSGGHDGSSATAVAGALMELWRSSPGHDQTMTDPEVDQVGFGVVVDDDGTAWGTAVFRRCDGSSCAGGAQGPAADTSVSWAPPPPPEPEPEPAPKPEATAEPEPEPAREPEPEPEPAPPSPAPTPVLPPEASLSPTSPTTAAPSPSPAATAPLVAAAIDSRQNATPADPWPIVILLGAALAAMAGIVRQLRD